LAAKVKFDFKDSNQFRIVHVDGVFGGPTPGGTLYASMFNERNPMPTQVVYSLDGSQLGAELMDERVCSEALTRTHEVALIMSFDTAKVVRDWLTRQIEDLERRAAATTADLARETKH
jgi:hypothetical protein